VEPDQLDQMHDLRLGAVEQKPASASAQTVREHGEVDHQRRVGEGQVAQVDQNIALGAEGEHQSPSAEALRASILVSGAQQDRRIVGELDDASETYKTDRRQRKLNLSSTFRDPRKLVGMVTLEEVHDALREVIDPELGLDFVELGLIYGVDIDASGAIKVTYTLTTPGCPIGPQVEGQIQEFVGEIEGVTSVESELVFTPPWSPDLMSEDAKFALGF
jgi:metal-sulfur cluster biosynthetic enzyme